MKKMSKEESLLNEWLRLDNIRKNMNNKISSLNNKFLSLKKQADCNETKHKKYIVLMGKLNEERSKARHSMFDATLDYLVTIKSGESKDAFKKMAVAKSRSYQLNSVNNMLEKKYSDNFIQSGDIDIEMYGIDKEISKLRILLWLISIKQFLLQKQLITIYGQQAFNKIIKLESDSKQENNQENKQKNKRK